MIAAYRKRGRHLRRVVSPHFICARSSAHIIIILYYYDVCECGGKYHNKYRQTSIPFIYKKCRLVAYSAGYNKSQILKSK